MNKSIMKKAILIVVVITLLSIVSVGCTSILPTTGTVNITVTSGVILGKIMIDMAYDINMDEIYVGTTVLGILTIYDVPIGWHNFEAYSTFGSGYGSKGQHINSGINNVTITVPPFLI